jgi:hypothetical protein
MYSLKYINENIWWIIPSNGHYGVLLEGQLVTSNHLFEHFNNEEEWLNRLAELEITVSDNLDYGRN